MLFRAGQVVRGRPLLWVSGIGLAVFVLSLSAAKPDKTSTPRTPPGEEIFVPGPLRKIEIEIAGAALAALEKENRQYTHATFRDGDTVLPDVGVHLKGAAGSFRSLDDRPALTVNFGKFIRGGRWHGLQKIHLNNSVQDDTLLTENICGELFRRAGVPAPRVSNARVVLNGRDLGIYVLIEGFDKTFLREYYRNAKGNLYDGGFCKDIDQPLEKLNGNDTKDQPELKALVDAADEPDLARRWARLDQLLYMDHFISYCALEIMTWDWDGYVLKPNNYKLFWDSEADRIDFFPHGMDQMFSQPNGPILPDFNGLVARAMMETPEGHRRYLARMAELMTNVFDVAAITNRVNRYAAPIHAAFAERDAGEAKNYEWRVRNLCERIADRAVSIARQLKEQQPAEAKSAARVGPAVPAAENRLQPLRGGIPPARFVETSRLAGVSYRKP